VAESEGGRAGFSSLGARGKRAEKVAEEAVDALREYWGSGACIDSHLADQLLPFMAVAKGPSSFTTHPITGHLITNLWVIQQFVDATVSLRGEKGSQGRVEVTPSG
jgi:RNA 3'-terminal phosphate cyclase